ncbi:hypothetical protein SEPCBS119000_006133 [Sporothrix epigloea]|uniref:Cyclin-dependent protein kinase complex component n=1 Tax=Sporothrix epigloea TaxID=1892477 RepID=A0ABP0E4S4_9PEZI
MADDSRQSSQDAGSMPVSPPPPPVPASDPRLFQSCTDPKQVSSPRLASLTDDIFDLPPLAALHMLGAGVEALVRITGDIPPTPPPLNDNGSTHTNMRSMQAEKEVIVRTLSENSLAQLHAKAEKEDAAKRRRKEEQDHNEEQEQKRRRELEISSSSMGVDRSTPPRDENDTNNTPAAPAPSRLPPTPPPAKPILAPMDIDGVHLRSNLRYGQPQSPSQTAGATPALSSSGVPILVVPPPEPYIIIGADSQPLNVQHSAITRKFYSKKAPPIGISEYLLRLHRFCPMSTGVYLATSFYIYRLAVTEKAIAVTRRNAHRLLLAGLRVAMKALEDLSYAHAKMARVGGVTEAELARLEINFCFLAGFELSLCADDMRQHWMLMKSGRAVGSLEQDGTAAVLASMDAMSVPRRPKVAVPS